MFRIGTDMSKKKTEATETQKELSVEEAEVLVQQALKKGANPWTLTHHNWAVLERQVKSYMTLPTFRARILDMLNESDKECKSVVYDENLSNVVRMQPLLRLFKNDLVRNMILCLNGGTIPEQMRNWVPFGGDHYYHELKDKWYSEKQKELKHTWLESSLNKIVAEHNNRHNIDPELPIWSEHSPPPEPSQITISMIDTHKLSIEWDSLYGEINLREQVGLHGAEGLWNKNEQKPNANMKVLIDLWLNTNHIFDMTDGSHQSFKTGLSNAQRKSASRQVSKLNGALNKILKLAIDPKTEVPHTWFAKEGTTYIPKFTIGRGGFDIARDVNAELLVRAERSQLSEYAHSDYNPDSDDAGRNQRERMNNRVAYDEYEGGYDTDLMS